MKQPAFAFVAALLTWCLGVSPAQAHSQSSSRLTLHLVERQPQALTLHMTLVDLLHLVDLDGNGDGQLTWGEVSASERKILDLVSARVLLYANGDSCRMSAKQQASSLTTLAAAPALQVALQVHCPPAANPGSVRLSYHLFFDEDPTHRALLRVTGGIGVGTYLLTTDERELKLP